MKPDKPRLKPPTLKPPANDNATGAPLPKKMRQRLGNLAAGAAIVIVCVVGAAALASYVNDSELPEPKTEHVGTVAAEPAPPEPTPDIAAIMAEAEAEAEVETPEPEPTQGAATAPAATAVAAVAAPALPLPTPAFDGTQSEKLVLALIDAQNTHTEAIATICAADDDPTLCGAVLLFGNLEEFAEAAPLDDDTDSE